MPHISGDTDRQVPLRKSATPLRTLKKQEESGSGTSNEIWLLTLSDMLMLLLIFFVLLFALPYLQQAKPGPEAKTARPEQAYPPAAAAPDRQPVRQPEAAADASQNEAVARLETDLAVMMGGREGEQGVTVERRLQRVVLTFPEQIVFDTGRAELKGSVRPVLEKVAAFVAGHPRLAVEIQGHTDDRPIHNRRYPSNWELSADRATQVARALVEMGVDPSALSIRGFAEYRPVQNNLSDADRLKNRRVEIQFSLVPSS